MDYSEWNRAIVQYVTAGLPTGASVYLSIDEDSLEDIGRRTVGNPSEGSWTDDFLNAVQTSCISHGQVSLSICESYPKSGPPLCVAFLAATVLAASHMAEEESTYIFTADHNYFTRLRKVLGLSTEVKGRPPGLPTGAEEFLWWQWKRFLLERNFLPSAERGYTTASRFIHYPMSQTILRQGDIARLAELFRDERATGRLRRFPDANTMGAWLRNYHFRWQHLAELAKGTDMRRFAATVDALLELYYAIDFSVPTATNALAGRTACLQRLIAGFYRIEDSITGEIEYWLYPREPKRGVAGRLEIERGGQLIPLRLERPGWFFPPWQESLAGGSHYALRGDARWNELVVPQAAFRVLVSDPNDPDSNVFAEWQAPGVEETFLLVCRESYVEQVEELRKQKLIAWAEDIVPLDGANVGWFEFHNCMILSLNWNDAHSVDAELCEALRPRLRATISFSGGLRAPLRNHRGWMTGYPPVLRVSAFQEYVRLRIINMACPDAAVFNDTVSTQEPLIDLPELSAGRYLVEALIAGKTVTTQSMDIVDWQALNPVTPEMPDVATRLGGHRICGALIEQKCDEMMPNAENFKSNGQTIQQDSQASASTSVSAAEKSSGEKENVAEASLPSAAPPISG